MIFINREGFDVFVINIVNFLLGVTFIDTTAFNIANFDPLLGIIMILGAVVFSLGDFYNIGLIGILDLISI